MTEEFTHLALRKEAGGRRAAARLAQFIDSHPQLVPWAEAALRDPSAAELGRLMLKAIGTPPAVEALRRFVTSKDGTEDSRMAAGRALLEMGAIEGSETLPFWADGQWQQIAFNIVDLTIGESRLPQRAQRQYAQAFEFMETDRADEAVPLLQKLAREYPDMACFHNDLGAAYLLAGRDKEGVAARIRATEVDPTYAPARTFMAHRCLERGDVDGAREWIRPLLKVTRMHPKHYAGLMHVQGRLALEEGDVDQARSIMEMIRELGPTEDVVEHLTGLIAKHEAARKPRRR